MPGLYGKAYLIDWLSDLGFAMYSTMGSSPLTFCEIYQGLDGTNLTPWEAKTIHTLSCDYVSQSQKATDKNCPPPFSLPKTKEQIQKENNSLLEALKSLSK